MTPHAWEHPPPPAQRFSFALVFNILIHYKAQAYVHYTSRLNHIVPI